MSEGCCFNPQSVMAVVNSKFTMADRLGAFKVRWGIGRMSYTVAPGLYALGSPDADSEVLVTASYKLSFDTLRSALGDESYWILVLDTRGVNVWCAAGAGTFGTDELVRRIEITGLNCRVNHRRVMVPQLGAPGIAAHLVKQRSGFSVVYGPVRASDIPAFIRAGHRAVPAMRKKSFLLRERLALIPIELTAAPRLLIPMSLLFGILGGLLGNAGIWADGGRAALSALLAGAFALLAGAVLTPALLPLLPGRAFWVKSLAPGTLSGVATAALLAGTDSLGTGHLAWFLIVTALSAFLAMNFTGASTYTSPSGVRREMRLGLPLQIGAVAAGLLLWVGSLPALSGVM
ncbi:MAG: mercury methylation corrinoid protein HgcA [Candidatus Fermentibacteraceae bacterium]